MRLRISLLFQLFLPLAAANLSYQIAGNDPGPWPQILSAIGLVQDSCCPANLFVVRDAAPGSVPQWMDKIEKGSVVVVEGDSELARALGFQPTTKRTLVHSIVDQRAPKLSIIWAKPVEIPVFVMPEAARVLATERWDGAPVMATIRRGAGAALWVAVTPGEQGYERFPYLLQALADLGVQPPFRSSRLWAFFDSAYRSRVDVNFFAERWRKAGISALHVAVWHNYDADEQRDVYLKALIEACHRHGILVYAWLELPHVSEAFWADHPEWREKTALLQDAQLDWRKLINLTNQDAFAAVSAGVKGVIQRFDWDGVNLAELYFESLEGAANAARFTPMNHDVRRGFQQQHGFDPLLLFQSPAPDPQRLKIFLDYRADLARRQQERWIEEIESMRAKKPDLDLVLTHVDDRFDKKMRDLIGADVTGVLPMLEKHNFTFLIEDPATVWNLGPQRYPQIAAQYQPLTQRQDRLAMDINIVERYQDVYPTKLQTGTELFELIHSAARAFSQVALYFENSILTQDLALLPAAAATVNKVDQQGAKLTISSRGGVGVNWQGPALVDGAPWPVRDGTTLWVPAGSHVIEPCDKEMDLKLVDFNGNLQSATVRLGELEIAYASNSRALATIDRRPGNIEIDGAPAHPPVLDSGSNFVLLLPRGQHLVHLEYANQRPESPEQPK